MKKFFFGYNKKRKIKNKAVIYYAYKRHDHKRSC